MSAYKSIIRLIGVFSRLKTNAKNTRITAFYALSDLSKLAPQKKSVFFAMKDNNFCNSNTNKSVLKYK